MNADGFSGANDDFAATSLLYGAGDLARLNLGGLAVVGSRNIDAEGRVVYVAPSAGKEPTLFDGDGDAA
ncbi:MAG: hypothetical protein ACRELF_17495 [Gemmataceae bacterium]